MSSIRGLRQAQPFDARFVAAHPLLWPLEKIARAFAGWDRWPPVQTWGAVFAATAVATGPAAGAPPVTFTAAAPRPRRGGRRPAFDRDRLYDTSIAERGVVPSRERSWHDFMNALVWGAFPRSKAALHRRQAALVQARIDPALPRLLPHRTRPEDGLAMIDEGGVLALEAPERALHLVFGHALFEGFVLGVAGMTARMVQLPVPALAGDPVAQADAALAVRLADPAMSTLPGSLPRVFVPDVAVGPWTRP